VGSPFSLSVSFLLYSAHAFSAQTLLVSHQEGHLSCKTFHLKSLGSKEGQRNVKLWTETPFIVPLCHSTGAPFKELVQATPSHI